MVPIRFWTRVAAWPKVAAVGLAILWTVGVASAAAPVDLQKFGDLGEALGAGDARDLKPGVLYGASRFPLQLRLRPPDAFWGGGQFESGRFRFVQFGHHHRPGGAVLAGVGVLTIETAVGTTPSVAATVSNLHATPLLKAGPSRPAHVAGYTGSQFDATVVGTNGQPPRGISVNPFTPNRQCGYCTRTMHGKTLDTKFAGKGQAYRIIVIGVGGKTVVIYLESIYADQKKYPPATMFPTFLPYAQKLLAGLKLGP